MFSKLLEFLFTLLKFRVTCDAMPYHIRHTFPARTGNNAPDNCCTVDPDHAYAHITRMGVRGQITKLLTLVTPPVDGFVCFFVFCSCARHIVSHCFVFGKQNEENFCPTIRYQTTLKHES
jgi:hypothetical protein